ncbi:hypothetical protein AgCh_022287 [Apium graveolens]
MFSSSCGEIKSVDVQSSKFEQSQIAFITFRHSLGADYAIMLSVLSSDTVFSVLMTETYSLLGVGGGNSKSDSSLTGTFASSAFAAYFAEAATFLLQTLDACDCVVTINRYLNLIIRRVHVCHPSGGFVDHPSGSFVDHPSGSYLSPDSISLT